MKNSKQLTVAAIILLGLGAFVLMNFKTANTQTTDGANKTTPTPNDLSQFPIVNYDLAESSNREEREKRREKSKRYDKMNLVIKNPNPGTGGTTRFDEIPPPPAIPANESEIVIIGEVLDAAAYLSNDKSGVYSEFTIKIEKVLKNNETHKVERDCSITMDRTGGWVQYPNGQKVFYEIAEKVLPLVGKRYVLFLTNLDQSPNYNILTGYELKDGKVYPLDMNSRGEKFKGTDEKDFITIIQDLVKSPSQG